MKNLDRIQLTKRVVILSVILIALAIMFVVLIVVGIVSAQSKGKYDVNSSFHIKTDSDFVESLRHNAEANPDNRKFYKYYFDNDIVVSVNDLPDNIDFYGELNGQGHVLTIQSDDIDILDKPIFNIIHSNAVINRLNIITEGVRLSAENKNNVSLLATTNNGTIKNCSIKIGEIEIGSCPNTAGLVNFNCGQIFNIGLTVNSITSTINNEVSWKSSFGAVATVNYADISNILLDVSFDDELLVFKGQYINNHVGYVFGGLSDSGNIKDIYIFGTDDDDFKNLLKASDTYETEKQIFRYVNYTYKDIGTALQTEIQNKFNAISDINEFTNCWSWENTTEKFPELI